MRHQVILRVIANLLIPFILMFAFYVQLNGEYGPGGGFQAGVLLAVAFMLYSFIFGIKKSQAIISTNGLLAYAGGGVLLYAGVGIASLLRGGAYLNYSVLRGTVQGGQQLGIMLVELGVGLTVFAAMLLLFYTFVEQKAQGE